MIELFGWAGSILLGICGIPQAVQCLKQGHSDGINAWFMWMWFIGEAMTFLYIAVEQGWGPLILNYTINTCVICIIVWYRYFPRR